VDGMKPQLRRGVPDLSHTRKSGGGAEVEPPPPLCPPVRPSGFRIPSTRLSPLSAGEALAAARLRRTCGGRRPARASGERGRHPWPTIQDGCTREVLPAPDPLIPQNRPFEIDGIANGRKSGKIKQTSKCIPKWCQSFLSSIVPSSTAVVWGNVGNPQEVAPKCHILRIEGGFGRLSTGDSIFLWN